MATKPKVNPKQSIIGLLKEDSQFKDFRSIVTTIREALNLEKDKNEALQMQATRTSRRLYENVASAKAVMEANLRDMSYRSRLTEIRVNLTSSSAILDEAIKSMRSYIQTQYYDELSSYSTVDAKRNMIDRVQKSALSLQAEIQSLLELLDFLIKDIDQTGFGLRNIVEVLKILDGTKPTRNI